MLHRTAPLLALLSMGLCASSALADTDHKVIRSANAMGTAVHITVWTDDEAAAVDAIGKAFAEFRRVDQLMSSWTKTGAVARINDSAGSREPVEVDAEVFGVVERALDAARTTRGAFDITVGAFRGLWKFDQDKDGSIPAADAVAGRLPLVNFRRVRVNRKKRTVYLAKKGMRITLGGIAKGHAVDNAVAILREAGFQDFILQAGGDLYVSGQKGEEPWVVGIRDPRGGRSAPFAILPLSDATFSTSGDYERSVIVDGKRYHHILDPKTGRPASRVRSVTVKADDAITADVLSTSLFVMGVERGMKLVERTRGVEAVFVDADNQVHVSSGLQGKLQLLHPPTEGI